MSYNEYKYSSFDLMNIFGIKKGSWQSVKKKYNLDNYATKIFDTSQNQNKFMYNEQAYNILKDNYNNKIIEEVKENPKMLALISENTTLKATIEEYKNLNTKFELMYNEEKQNKENILKDNITLQINNENFKNQNNKLSEENHNLQKEIERLKNRNFLARLFNK